MDQANVKYVIMVRENINIVEENIKRLSKKKITKSTAQMLSTYYGAKIALENVLCDDGEFVLHENKNAKHDKILNDGDTIQFMFPSFSAFQSKHNLHNLKKVLKETEQFLEFIYSGLKSENEKYAYYDMLSRINK